MHRIVVVFSLILSQLSFAETYQFAGKHFLGSYLECDNQALSNTEELIKAMDYAVEQSGATVLGKIPYIFSPNGITIVYALSESHASIHTYPEHGSCFVDLFTCGDRCSSEKFHEALSAYLRPKKIDMHLYIRDNVTTEISTK